MTKTGRGTLRILAPNGIEGSTLLGILDKGLGFRGLGFRVLGTFCCFEDWVVDRLYEDIDLGAICRMYNEIKVHGNENGESNGHES